MDDFGFIITRHVNSLNTNKYWNQSVKLIRTLYPRRKIVIIDDNSNYDFVKEEFDYSNLQIIQSEFPGRGELLPYYYFLKYKFFKNAVIIHDSVFLHEHIRFDKLKGIDVLPLWFFYGDSENVENTKRITRNLKNNYIIFSKLNNKELNVLRMSNDKWNGCFGVQSYINLNFLERIEQKYKITNLLSVVKCRADRCCLERIFGILFYTECPNLLKRKSMHGNIKTYQTWGYSYDQYIDDFHNKQIKKSIIKVWTGR